jgi:hypothetical protein
VAGVNPTQVHEIAHTLDQISSGSIWGSSENSADLDEMRRQHVIGASMIGIALSIVGLSIIPVLAVCACTGWVQSDRKELPTWRNALCTSAIVLLILNWLGIAILEIPAVVHPQYVRDPRLMEVMLTLSHPLSLFSLVFGFALRRNARLQVIVSAILLLVCWPLGYV